MTCCTSFFPFRQTTASSVRAGAEADAPAPVAVLPLRLAAAPGDTLRIVGRLDATTGRFFRRMIESGLGAFNLEDVDEEGAISSLEAFRAALDHIDELEDQLTVFRAHSEVSRLNATAPDRPVEVALIELEEPASLFGTRQRQNQTPMQDSKEAVMFTQTDLRSQVSRHPFLVAMAAGLTDWNKPDANSVG